MSKLDGEILRGALAELRKYQHSHPRKFVETVCSSVPFYFINVYTILD